MRVTILPPPGKKTSVVELQQLGVQKPCVMNSNPALQFFIGVVNNDIRKKLENAGFDVREVRKLRKFTN